MICDIGNGTMNLLRTVNKKPDAQRMSTEKYGTHQCALLIREQMMKLHHAALDDTIVTEVLKKGTADIDEQYLGTVIKTAKENAAGIFRRLREHEYDPKKVHSAVSNIAEHIHALKIAKAFSNGGKTLRINFCAYDFNAVFGTSKSKGNLTLLKQIFLEICLLRTYPSKR